MKIFIGKLQKCRKLQKVYVCVFVYFRFMESELELNDVVQEMHIIATAPDLYHILVDLNTVQSLLQLLSHENTDILYHITKFVKS